MITTKFTWAVQVQQLLLKHSFQLLNSMATDPYTMTISNHLRHFSVCVEHRTRFFPSALQTAPLGKQKWSTVYEELTAGGIYFLYISSLQETYGEICHAESDGWSVKFSSWPLAVLHTCWTSSKTPNFTPPVRISFPCSLAQIIILLLFTSWPTLLSVSLGYLQVRDSQIGEKYASYESRWCFNIQVR